MKNTYIRLSRIAGICLLGYTITSSVNWLLSPRFFLFDGFCLFLYIGFVIAAFFVPKNKFIIFPVWLFSISISAYSLFWLTMACVSRTSEAEVWTITSILLVFSIASVTLMSVVFAKTKPFRKDEQIPLPEEKRRKESAESSRIEVRSIDLDEIARAKELLDAGAITPEEFYELKRRAFH